MSSQNNNNCNLSFQVLRNDPVSPSSSSASGEHPHPHGEQTINLQSYERNFSTNNTSSQTKIENSNACRNFRTQGKLGLLALAMECLADSDSKVLNNWADFTWLAGLLLLNESIIALLKKYYQYCSSRDLTASQIKERCFQFLWLSLELEIGTKKQQLQIKKFKAQIISRTF